MNKRKILTMAMALCMVAILAVGGTLAYFTDTDYNKNVMVTGDVKIDQIEKEYDKDGNKVDFKDDKPLYPVTEDYAGNNVLEYKDPNKVDKIVTVKNTGHTTAYVRTLIAFEAGAEGKTFGANKEADLLSGSYIHFGYTGNNKVLFAPVHEANGGDIYFTKDGTRYVVAVAYYNDSTAIDSEGTKTSAIAAGETTAPSLNSVWLQSTAGNEFYDYVGEKYDILVLSQAVQTEGFATAEAAFDAAYGKLTTANVTKWFTDYTTSKDESKD